MRLTLLTVGKAKAPFAEADAHYRRLLARNQPVAVVEARNADDLVRRIPRDAHVAALDGAGEALDSLGWSRWLERRRLDARDVCLLLGGAHGLPAEALAAARERISLGPITLPHQLARIVLLEQLFRSAKILAGEAYHY